METVANRTVKKDFSDQYKYIEILREIFKDRRVKPKAFTDTYGCQQNVADTQKVAGMLIEMGFELCDDKVFADIIVINTCAVREHAEMKVFSGIGELSHLKKSNPDLIVAVCGCMVQQDYVADRLKKSYPYVDIVFGTNMLSSFPELLCNHIKRRERVINISSGDADIGEGVPIKRGSKTKALVSIMYGCNNFCSYCIVPYVRGRERSRLPQYIQKEVEELVSSGFTEITLLGQNVNSYGNDLDMDVKFPDLLKRLNDIDGDFLIRFMTSNPKDATHDLMETMAYCDKVAKQLHLPFQSGSDRILRLMNRKYTARQYKKLIYFARSLMPNISLTSDVIVGFPTESQDDFQKTFNLVEEIKFDALFTFIYSKRSGTPASQMEDNISKEEKQRNFERLLKLQNNITLDHHKNMIGKTFKISVEGRSNSKEHPMMGRLESGGIVLIPEINVPEGHNVHVEIVDASLRTVVGRPV